MREFKIEDCQLFPITLSWKGAETDDNELEVFPRFEKIPLSKLLTIYKREPFEIEARYRFPNNIPFNEPRIGKFQIGNVTPNPQGENSEIKLKARITKNGIFEISSPQQIETVEVEVAAQAQQAQPHDQKGLLLEIIWVFNLLSILTAVLFRQPNQPDEAGQANQAPETDRKNSQDGENEESNANEESAANGSEAGEQNAASGPQKQVKRKTKAIDLPLTARVPQLTKNELNLLFEQEVKKTSFKCSSKQWS